MDENDLDVGKEDCRFLQKPHHPHTTQVSQHPQNKDTDTLLPKVGRDTQTRGHHCALRLCTCKHLDTRSSQVYTHTKTHTHARVHTHTPTHTEHESLQATTVPH